LLQSGPYPSRAVEQNVADIRAQIAANHKGVSELNRICQEVGLATVKAYMQHVQNNAESCVRRAIGSLHHGQFTLALDNGAQIQVALTVDQRSGSAQIDFTGSSAQLSNNFNAPKSITTAAVLYVFRCLVDDDIPLNAGCLRPLHIIVPEGSFLNPTFPAAVVAGNVETSSALTNALMGALGVMASSPCTMSNLTFGNDRVQYYETIAGGSGAGFGFNGTSVVQTHMTNSRLTDPEILEWRYPVQLESYRIRPHTGGAGRWTGGDGGERTIRFLEPMTVSILSNGRKVPSFGLHGGSAGALGDNRVIRADGEVVALASTDQIEVNAQDRIVISTPGGGGFGALEH
jgi:5-oxoprolinase (ATP-hydrolysing)